ncbi:hypothetical protein RHOSPDRAFT_32354 [Rhodotorula sp. JG-1b]|nr:hypothetical protein RHOSPDRAFT_32354 [Rhodotorula sp. JG-1b]
MNRFASGAYGLPSPISPPPSSSGTHDLFSDALLAAAVVNPRMGPSALDVTLSPPLQLAELGDPFELLPPRLQTPPRSSSQGWPAVLDDGDFDEDGSKTPPAGLLSPPGDAFLSDSEVALGLEMGHPASPVIVSSDLGSVGYGGLRICLDPSEYWASVPFQPERRVKMEDTEGIARSPSPRKKTSPSPSPSPSPPSRPEPRQRGSLLDRAEEEDRKPNLSAPMDTQAGARPPDNVTPFIWKLFKLLENDIYAPWIQWDEEGRHILVALSQHFVAVLGLFFRHSSVKSFIYGFRRVPTSRLPNILRSLEATTVAGVPRPDAYAAFQHPEFVRAGASRQPRLLARMRPGGGQTSRTSTSTRNTRSRAARTIS